MKIFINSNIKDAIKILNKNGVRTLVVLDLKKRLIGTLSDGNIRKSILKGYSLKSLINNIFDKKPIFLYENKYNLDKVKKIFLEKKIQLIPIIDKTKKLKQIIYLEDIIGLNNLDFRPKKNNSNLGVVIMAGGKGLRMQPYTKVFPKPLLPINDSTILDVIVSKFLNKGINNFYITTNYKHKMIYNHFKSNETKINYKLIKENRTLGTAGSLAFLKHFKEDLFLVTNCDILIDEDYNKIIKYHVKNNNDLTIVASKKSIKIPYGVCLLDKNKTFTSFVEKPNYDFLLNIGFYLIDRKVLKTLKTNQTFNMDKFILKLQKHKKKIGIYEIDFEKWQDFGNWESYLDNNKHKIQL